MEDMTEIKALLERYYDGVSKGSGWGHLLSEDFLLTGTIAKESKGRDLYVDNSFFKMVRGVKVRELIAEGDRGFALVSYDLVSPRGTPFSSEVAEFWKMNEGKLGSVAIYFDTAAFSASLAR